jgi:hypothetical protein
MKKDCNHKRFAQLTAKCSDLCCWSSGDIRHDGYVPLNVGISSDSEDYVEFKYCLDCGQILGSQFPISNKAVISVTEMD